MEKNYNLIDARKKAGLSQAQLAEKIDAQQPYIAKLEKGEPFSEDQAMRIAKILGVKAEKIMNKNITDIITPHENITKTNQFITKSKSLIPFYNADFMAGKSEAYYGDGSSHPDYYMDVPEFYGCIAFRAYGESMEPIIKSSSILFGLKLDDDWRNSLEYGQIYGITMNDGRRYLKYIRRAVDHKKQFILKSANKEFDDFEVDKSRIKNIWLIQGWIDKRA